MGRPNQKKPTEFATRDIYLATVIKLSGVPLIRVEKQAERAIFVFRSSGKDIEELIGRYFNQDLRLDPKSLFENWKALKALAFSTVGDVRQR